MGKGSVQQCFVVAGFILSLDIISFIGRIYMVHTLSASLQASFIVYKEIQISQEVSVHFSIKNQRSILPFPS